MPSERKNYRIIELKAENVKRLKAITIHPKGDIINITGRNGEGKSSVLDCIFLALDGAEAAKKNPDVIRKGEEKASVRLDLGDLIVSRRYTPTNSYLDVYTKDMAKYPSPQAVLDKLMATIAFDPLQFSNLDSKEQRKLLLQFSEVSIDLEQHDQKIKTAADERTIANKELAKAKAVLSQAIPPTTMEPKTVPDVEASLARRSALAEEKSTKNNRLQTLTADGASLRAADMQLEEEIKTLEATLETKKKSSAETKQKLATTIADYKTLKAEVDAAKYDEQITAMDTAIKGSGDATAHNAAIERYNALQVALKTAEDTATAKAQELEALNAEKESALREAKFPIEGLGVNEDGVTYGEIPFVQCSSAERLKVGIAMVIAMNPALRVIRIQDGSILDSNSMAVIEKMAEAYDLQFWIERVDETGKVGIVMEDGEVAADNYSEPVPAPEEPAAPAKKTPRKKVKP